MFWDASFVYIPRHPLASSPQFKSNIRHAYQKVDSQEAVFLNAQQTDLRLRSHSKPQSPSGNLDETPAENSRPLPKKVTA
jgi:hypothetical protein